MKFLLLASLLLVFVGLTSAFFQLRGSPLLQPMVGSWGPMDPNSADLIPIVKYIQKQLKINNNTNFQVIQAKRKVIFVCSYFLENESPSFLLF
jgi:hypothetical protein